MSLVQKRDAGIQKHVRSEPSALVARMSPGEKCTSEVNLTSPSDLNKSMKPHALWQHKKFFHSCTMSMKRKMRASVVLDGSVFTILSYDVVHALPYEVEFL